MLELFPEGFEEVDGDDGIELVAYTDGAGQERFAAVFGAGAAVQDAREMHANALTNLWNRRMPDR